MIKKSKINDIRSILSRLGDIVTKKYIKDVKKELYEIEKKQNLSGNEKKKKKIYDGLVELARKFDKKRWIQTLWSWWFKLLWNKSIRKLFNDIDNDDYYKPVLFKGSFKNIINVI